MGYLRGRAVAREARGVATPRRAVPAAGEPVPQLDHPRRRAGAERARRLSGGERALSPLRLARLPLGAPDADLPRS